MSLFGSEDRTATGVVRDVAWHETETPPSLSFRVEQTDDVGNVTGYTQILVSSVQVEDVISAGDEVTVRGSLNGDGILEASEVKNETTGVTFTPDSGELGAVIVLGPPMLGVLLGFLGGVVGVMPGSAARTAIDAALEGAILGGIGGLGITFVLVLGLVVWGAVT